jgi:hypothetical protein
MWTASQAIMAGAGATAVMLMAVAEVRRTPPQPERPVAFSVVLIRANNDEQPTSPKLRPADGAAKAQLSHMFRWQNYWEANRQRLALKGQPTTRARLSPECEVEVEYISPTIRETRIYVNGVVTARSRRNVSAPSPAIDGAATDVDGAWFVLVEDEWVEEATVQVR